MILVLEKNEFYNERVDLYFIDKNNEPKGVSLGIEQLHDIIFNELNQKVENMNPSHYGVFNTKDTQKEIENRNAYCEEIRNRKHD